MWAAALSRVLVQFHAENPKTDLSSLRLADLQELFPIAHEDEGRPVIRLGEAGACWIGRVRFRLYLAVQQIQLCQTQRFRLRHFPLPLDPSLIKIGHQIARAVIVHYPQREITAFALQLRRRAEAIHLAAIGGVPAHSGVAGGKT